MSSVPRNQDGFLEVNRHLPLDFQGYWLPSRHVRQRYPPALASQADEDFVRAGIGQDTEMLRDLGIIDYSLIVFFDEERMHLRVGIIDYLRTFTWDKMAESTVKGLVAEDRPTIVSAPEYPTRRAFVLRQI